MGRQEDGSLSHRAVIVEAPEIREHVAREMDRVLRLVHHSLQCPDRQPKTIPPYGIYREWATRIATKRSCFHG